ncbi:MAG: methionine--tRNA ligase subunit beta, partial [Cyclobacteriaceae bacterium]
KTIPVNGVKWEDAGSIELVSSGALLGEQQYLFERIEDEQIEAQVKKLTDTRAKNMETDSQKVTPIKEEMKFDDFMKMDLRVGEVKAAEKVVKSDKLIKLTVDTGADTRIIVSGIAKHFSAEEMVGKKVTVLANLAPRKIMGIESQGMLLFAENPDGSLKAVNPDSEAENGATIA